MLHTLSIFTSKRGARNTRNTIGHRALAVVLALWLLLTLDTLSIHAGNLGTEATREAQDLGTLIIHLALWLLGLFGNGTLAFLTDGFGTESSREAQDQWALIVFLALTGARLKLAVRTLTIHTRSIRTNLGVFGTETLDCLLDTLSSLTDVVGTELSWLAVHSGTVAVVLAGCSLHGYTLAILALVVKALGSRSATGLWAVQVLRALVLDLLADAGTVQANSLGATAHQASDLWTIRIQRTKRFHDGHGGTFCSGRVDGSNKGCYEWNNLHGYFFFPTQLFCCF